MEIRLATVEDAQVISALNADVQALHANALPHLFKPPSAETFPVAVVAGLLADPNNRFFIGYVGGEPAGYIYVEIRSRPATPMHHALSQVYIHHISIRPAYQHQGYGHALIREVKALARELGIGTVALDVWSFNAKARAFFAREGFTTFNERMWVEVGEGPPVSYKDQNYLRTDQYKNEANLSARIRLHQRFSTNPYPWHCWVFDHLQLAPQARILELGCGAGTLWLENAGRIPLGWEVTLSDLSAGMLQDAQRNLRDCPHPFTFAVIDAQAIPFADAHFDAVIANHMLQHVPDRAQALAEIRRVLRPGGCLYAASSGQGHLHELWALIDRFTSRPAAGRSLDFTLEAGAAELACWFAPVDLQRFANSLVVTEAAPLVDYALSGWKLQAGQRAAFNSFVEEELAAHGPIHITPDAGLLIATRPA